MTKSLRKVHRYFWMLLAVFLPVGILTSWLIIPNSQDIQTLSKSTAELLPIIVASRDKIDYDVKLRRDEHTWQLEWQVKAPLTYPSAVIYQLDQQMNNKEYVGRIEARGNYVFPLKSSDGFYLILYDFIHDQIIDTINFKP